ncbi:hypothetical protein Lalb_Chr10g0094051 [Lupinus albus]|uniref:Uncharacterized protein n=1 Tax=Lupinus albus TaxID=3870 RepID=A0A6A4PTY7_LUPAL|nr:hypothetical protein Lalb_Chr10g0094051 [Lupinus albus]
MSASCLLLLAGTCQRCKESYLPLLHLSIQQVFAEEVSGGFTAVKNSRSSLGGLIYGFYYAFTCFSRTHGHLGDCG